MELTSNVLWHWQQRLKKRVFAAKKSAHRCFELLDDQQTAQGYDYSSYYQDPSAYAQQGYDASSYNQQSYGSGYGSRDASGDGGRGHRYGGQEHGGSTGGYRDGGRDNDRYGGDSRGSYSRRDNYQDQPSRGDEGKSMNFNHFSGYWNMG